MQKTRNMNNQLWCNIYKNKHTIKVCRSNISVKSKEMHNSKQIKKNLLNIWYKDDLFCQFKVNFTK